MIKVGEAIPSVKIKVAGESGGGEEVSADAFFAGKKVALFALPGAFTPTCSAKHLPGFLEHHDALKAKGVDVIACLSVNDAWVMGAWGRDQKAFGKVVMLADGSAELTRALGLEVDLTASCMGVRSKRYAAIVENGIVKTLDVEQPGKFEVSTAQAVLGRL